MNLLFKVQFENPSLFGPHTEYFRGTFPCSLYYKWFGCNDLVNELGKKESMDLDLHIGGLDIARLAVILVTTISYLSSVDFMRISKYFTKPPSSITSIAIFIALQKNQLSSIKSPDMPTSISYASQPGPLLHPQHRPIQKRSSLSQKALFRTAAPPLLFSILIAGLLVELRARLASPLPAAPPGITVSMQGNTIAQRTLIWAESHWPGPWALPVLCVGALGALRALIWTCAAVLDSFDKRVGVSSAARVRIGRWEDASSVSGSDLLAGMFT